MLGNSSTLAGLLGEYLVIVALLVPLGGGALASICTYQFRRYYIHASFDTWKLKFNKAYPTVPAVANEIFALSKSTMATLLLLALSVQLGIYGYNGLFDLTKATAAQNVRNFSIAFWVVDFYSYAYHFVGHRVPEAWSIHRFHHKFYNPTPYGVIADDCLDQVIRAMPLLFLPLAISTLNWLVLSAVFAFDMYYGILLHSGHENIPARKVADVFQRALGTDLINTPCNHFLHHAISGGSTPKYCGFYVTIWDKIFGSEDKKNLDKFMKDLDTRTEAEFAKIEIPQYEVLATASYWKQWARGGKADDGTKVA